MRNISEVNFSDLLQERETDVCVCAIKQRRELEEELWQLQALLGVLICKIPPPSTVSEY